jgi:hypothetical protein
MEERWIDGIVNESDVAIGFILFDRAAVRSD